MNTDLINPSDTHLLPAYLRVPAACRYGSLGRTSLYEAIAEGRIKTSLIKKRGAQRGLRLIHRESLDAYIKSFEDEIVAADAKDGAED